MKLSDSFDSSEFSCRCGCGFADVDLALVTGLQALRDAIGKPITITSGCRCAKHNTAEGGAKRSMHVQGKAADILVAGMTPRALYEEAVKIPQLRGFGVAATFLHVDTRQVTARWTYNGGKQVAWRDA